MTTTFSGSYISGVEPHSRRWMLFVDGENLTARAQKIARDANVSLSEGPYYSRDVFVWFPYWSATRGMKGDRESMPLQPTPVRAYYYTSVVGGEEKIKSVKESLFELRFTPKVFKRSKPRGSKAVDITLATDMLGHAYRGNYDVAVLFAGDGDYVPLVEEVKRLGKGVRVASFEGSGLSDDLRLAADTVMYSDEYFLHLWKEYKQKESLPRLSRVTSLFTEAPRNGVLGRSDAGSWIGPAQMCPGVVSRVGCSAHSWRRIS